LNTPGNLRLRQDIEAGGTPKLGGRRQPWPSSRWCTIRGAPPPITQS